jgi:hypothetical protein
MQALADFPPPRRYKALVRRYASTSSGALGFRGFHAMVHDMFKAAAEAETAAAEATAAEATAAEATAAAAPDLAGAEAALHTTEVETKKSAGAAPSLTSLSQAAKSAAAARSGRLGGVTRAEAAGPGSRQGSKQAGLGKGSSKRLMVVAAQGTDGSGSEEPSGEESGSDGSSEEAGSGDEGRANGAPKARQGPEAEAKDSSEAEESSEDVEDDVLLKLGRSGNASVITSVEPTPREKLGQLGSSAAQLLPVSGGGTNLGAGAAANPSFSNLAAAARFASNMRVRQLAARGQTLGTDAWSKTAPELRDLYRAGGLSPPASPEDTGRRARWRQGQDGASVGVPLIPSLPHLSCRRHHPHPPSHPRAPSAYSWRAPPPIPTHPPLVQRCKLWR